jgi:hypothetical protein
MNIPKKIIQEQGAVHLSNVIPIEFCQFFTHVLMRQEFLDSKKGDEQIPNAKAILAHEVMFETLLERMWPVIENTIEEELLPTYAYARLYSNGDILEKHTDRPACEISVTIQLGRTHNYTWPIHMGSMEYMMNEGDAIIYKGCEIEHWRNKCDGPEGYLSGQVFLHYVRKNGLHAGEAGDSTGRVPPSFVKNRSLDMESK